MTDKKEENSLEELLQYSPGGNPDLVPESFRPKTKQPRHNENE